MLCLKKYFAAAGLGGLGGLALVRRARAEASAPHRGER
jgi:hypothetical protein